MLVNMCVKYRIQIKEKFIKKTKIFSPKERVQTEKTLLYEHGKKNFN